MRRWLSVLTAVLVASVLAPPAQAKPQAPRQNPAEVTLQRAEVFFHTNDEDKDHDTRIKIVVTDQNGTEVAVVEDTFGHFDDGSDHGPFPMRITTPIPRDVINAGMTTMVIDPNGNDTWRFNLRVGLFFSDGSRIGTDRDGLELSEGDTTKRWAIGDYSDEYKRMDFSWIAQPDTLADSVRDGYARRIPALLWESCVQPDNTGRGEGSASHVASSAALLKLIEDPTGRTELARALGTEPPLMADPTGLYRRCLDRIAPGWRPPPTGAVDRLSTHPGWRRVISDLMRIPAHAGKPGTDAVTTCRTNGSDTEDWDITMSLAMRAWGLVRTVPHSVLFGPADPASHPAKMAELEKEVAARVWLQGGTAKVDEIVCTIVAPDVPETENHTWMIRTTRFLHNELLPQTQTPPHQPKYVVEYNRDPNPDNRTNGVLAYLRDVTAQWSREDFKEYNARPYVRYQMIGLLNLYDFALDQSVRQDAKKVLDFLALKHAATSQDNQRVAPFRRKQVEQTPYLFQGSTTDSMYEAWVGGLPQPVRPAAGAGSFSGEMALAASATYRPPAWMADLQLDTRHRDYLQYFNGRNQHEVAYGGRDFTLTGGGRRTPCPYPGPGGICVGAGNDEGTMQPTVLIPRQLRTDTANTTDNPKYFDNVRLQSSWGKHISCVNRNIACGEKLIVPDRVVRDSPDCRITLSQPGQPLEIGLRFDRSCSPEPGLSYTGDCFFAYGKQIALAAGLPEIAYLVTHSCEPGSSDADRKKWFEAFVEYMAIQGNPRSEWDRCAGPNQYWIKVHTKQPPADRIDLTGVTEGRPVTAHGTLCTDEPGFELIINGQGGFPGTGALSGDLTLSGGRYPVPRVSLATTPDRTSAAGEQFALTATIHDTDNRVPTGKVAFLVGARVISEQPVTVAPDGTVSARMLTIRGLELGVRRVTAVYTGDEVFTGAAVTETHTVRPDLARAKELIEQGNLLWNRGERADGYIRTAGAIELIRALAAADPAHRRLMAEWLANPAANYLGELGRHGEAVEFVTESTELYDQLIRENPGDRSLTDGLIGALWEAVAIHTRTGDTAKADAARNRLIQLGAFVGRWTMTQSNGHVVTLELTGDRTGALGGRGTYNGIAGEIRDGRRTVDKVEFVIHWIDGAIGKYTGQRGADGTWSGDSVRLTGEPITARWTAIQA
ncbi:MULTISPECIES: Ig-like domain-containing protein [unclassified Crossiella]|uniref:Ig-like domain-containing protein n=1 Tax=unclassified Crossiella TaxID=2620835 RepID=UPI001FFFA026|nr:MULTISPECIES: Ig-like domain-containing protein [unclassified Crossiella]MCK2244488.1 Ig-like domain-containing protein [Crossiella sp. S99.2]MCK2258119.1 Ig-like domain-containing protein [Crossiella sp. S99.1]